jgi:hypothetical protein
MSNNKNKKQPYRALLASVKEEMGEPRVVESAQVKGEEQHTVKVKEAAKT